MPEQYIWKMSPDTLRERQIARKGELIVAAKVEISLIKKIIIFIFFYFDEINIYTPLF